MEQVYCLMKGEKATGRQTKRERAATKMKTMPDQTHPTTCYDERKQKSEKQTLPVCAKRIQSKMEWGSHPKGLACSTDSPLWCGPAMLNYGSAPTQDTRVPRLRLNRVDWLLETMKRLKAFKWDLYNFPKQDEWSRRGRRREPAGGTQLPGKETRRGGYQLQAGGNRRAGKGIPDDIISSQCSS